MTILLVATGLTAGATPAAALTGADFNPGMIISDATFYNTRTMSASDVQSFLNTMGKNCMAGEQPCLKDYRMNTVSKPAEAGLCKAYAGTANESAAQIVSKVSQACGINPQVLLVLLQKETSLVTKTAPTTSNYNRATGFGCPDTGPGNTANCNTAYYGFQNQLYRAARQYLVYRNNPTRYGYQAGRYNTIRYSPDASCGTQTVFIENQATAALYIYTPYVPNAAALANLNGTGDACSTYGNRNFWRNFTLWFGTTLDLKDTLGVRRGNRYFLSNRVTGGNAEIELTFGRADDVVFVGDWDGDGRDTLGVRRGNRYFLSNTFNGGNAEIELTFGRADDVVFVGDWDGDGRDTIGVRRGNQYFLSNTFRGGHADVTFTYGKASDALLVGDWDGDGRDTVGLRRAGNTYLLSAQPVSNAAPIQFTFGKATDEVFVGDWNDDARDTLGVRRGNFFYLSNRVTGGAAEIEFSLGRADDIVLVGDWDGQ